MRFELLCIVGPLYVDGNSMYMGWLRLVGSLKLQVSFAEYRLFHRDLLQKRPKILRSLLTVATPYLVSTNGIKTMIVWYPGGSKGGLAATMEAALEKETSFRRQFEATAGERVCRVYIYSLCT